MQKHVLAISMALSSCGVLAQGNYLDRYIGTSPVLTTIASSANQIHLPRDLDFKPGTNEWWVAQYGDISGGNTVLIFDAGLPSQSTQYRHDTHSDHFFYYPPAIAFSDIGEFASVGEIRNTSSPSSTFMGPTLWLADTSIYARVWQNNWAAGYPLGSHIDMLHQSPFSMGIAWDSLKVYWVMDGFNGNICRYDFVHDHGPGYDNHSAGKIWRYTDVTWTRVPLVPSHCILDRVNHWLYFVDGGTRRIRRMDVNSGTFAGNLTPPASGSEPLAGYYNYTGATVETIDSLSTQPCGIEYADGRLLVSDYTTGDIYLYDVSGAVPALLDTIVTGHPGMMGIRVGPDGRIWCVNHTDDAVYRLDVAAPATDAAIASIVSPAVENLNRAYYSTAFDVCSGSVAPAVVVKNCGDSAITALQLEWALDGVSQASASWSGLLPAGDTTLITLPSGAVADGTHLLAVSLLSVNGSADEVAGNNTLLGSFRSFSPATAGFYLEDFGTSAFPPAGCHYVHFNTNNYMSRAAPSAYGSGVGSLKMNNYAGPMNIDGQEDYFMLPLQDLSGAPASTYLVFDVAYAQYNSSSNDRLKVSASGDCGQTWTTLYNKSGSTLASTPVFSTGVYSPLASDWRTDSVSLSSLAGQSEVMFMFTSVSNYGNNLFLDNIRTGAIWLGTPGPSATPQVSVYPNPVQSSVRIECHATVTELVVTSLLGDRVMVSYPDSPAFSADLSGLADGVYFLRIRAGDQYRVTKIVKQ